MSTLVRDGVGVRMPALDGVRGLAILLVMVCHAPTVVPMPHSLFVVVVNGLYGVDLFFVLSGFLITGILIDAKASPTYFRNFYARRALRILPLYYGTVALLVLVGPWLRVFVGARDGAGGIEALQPWYWLHLTNWYVLLGGTIPQATVHFWSLAVEEQFYFVWPAVVLFTAPRQLVRVCVTLMVIGLLGGLGIAALGLPLRAIRVATFSSWQGLLVGAIVAASFREPVRWVASRWPSIGAVGAIGWLALEFAGPYGTELHRRLLPLKVLLIALAFGAVLVSVVTRSHPAWSVGPLRWLGRYSYALYVFHPFVYAAVHTWGPRSTAPAIAMALLVTMVLARVSWAVWEQPWLRLQARFPSGRALPSGEGITRTMGVASTAAPPTLY